MLAKKSLYQVSMGALVKPGRTLTTQGARKNELNGPIPAFGTRVLRWVELRLNWGALHVGDDNANYC